MNESRHLVPAQPGRLPANQSYELAPHSDRLDLSESISFFRRQARIILGVFLLCVLAAVLYSFFAPKEYKAEATVILTNETQDVVGNVPTFDDREALSTEIVDTQVEIIASRSMAERVSTALQLDNGLSESARRELLDKMQANVAAERSGRSYALAVSFLAPEPGEASRITNEYARQFSNWEVRSDQSRNADAREMVQQRLGELRAQAQADTAALQQYRIANNLLSTSGASLTEQEISTFNQQAAMARAQAAEDEARLRTALSQLNSGSSGDDVGEALGSPVISSLRIQEAEASSEVADLSSKYGPNHPQLIQAQSRLTEVRGRIQAEIERVVSNLRAKREVSAQRLASINGSLANARGKLSQNNVAMVGLSDLERAAESSQGIYETYLNRYKELLAAEGSERPHARILTLAEDPILPDSPNILLNIALSIVIGLGLGVLLAYIKEAAFHGISTPDEVEQATGERYLASIPLLKSVEPRIDHAVTAIQDAPNSAFAESFRALETAIGQVTHQDHQVIALTSALPDEGKTVISCCLSYVLAQSGKKTILIDCDIRRAGISRLLDMRRYEYGLVEILEGKADLDLAELADGRAFCVLPLRPSNEQPEHLLTGAAFKNLLTELRQHFDHIVLDLPPVLPIASAPIIASRADATVIATHWRKTSRFALRAALKRLPPDQVNVVGVALNQVDMRRRAYFERGDPSFYYDQYREYYA